jgi:hypothetical protein
MVANLFEVPFVAVACHTSTLHVLLCDASEESGRSASTRDCCLYRAHSNNTMLNPRMHIVRVVSFLVALWSLHRPTDVSSSKTTFQRSEDRRQPAKEERRHLLNNKPSPRIINGVESERSRHPYVALLTAQHVLKCGGSVSHITCYIFVFVFHSSLTFTLDTDDRPRHSVDGSSLHGKLSGSPNRASQSLR